MFANTRENSALPGYLFAVGATAIWSGNFIVARGLSALISPIFYAYRDEQMNISFIDALYWILTLTADQLLQLVFFTKKPSIPSSKRY